ncbi:acyl-CoA thioesterase [bacterium]|nr:acyl-CoA thioesterase [bacterium]
MFTVTVTPRFGDVDGLRHVNNTRLPEWFELGRGPFYRFFCPELDFERWNLILAHLGVDFQAPMILGHNVEIRTYVQRVGNSSFTTVQEAWQRGELCATGETVIVHYDFAAKRSLPIPDDTRTALLAHARPEP